MHTRKMAEKSHPENDRKSIPQEMTEKACPENEGMENAQHGERQKMHTLENDREFTT